MTSEAPTAGGGWKLWVAQGFGVGRIPVAPGTWGSLLGVLLTFGLLIPQVQWFYSLGCAACVWASIELAEFAEQRLKVEDPSSVVIDEIVAMPLCFIPWIWGFRSDMGHMPSPAELLHAGSGLLCPVVFLLFRLFDIWKPWPIRQSQKIQGGWGITIDDLLAAAFVAGLLGLWQVAFPSGLPLPFLK